MSDAMATLHALLHTDQPTQVDPAAVDALRADGCRITVHPQQGATLEKTGLGVWADYLRYRDGHGDRPIEVYQQTTSTQDVVRHMIESTGEKANGAIGIADEQTAGRGRLGRRWHAPPGGALTFSLAVVTDRVNADQLTLAAAVGVCRAIETVTHPPLHVRIKWPNDLLVDGKKLAGILVESFTVGNRAAAIIGIGVNVALQPDDLPPEVRGAATSMAICGQAVDRLALLAEIVAHFDPQQDMAAVTEAWRKRSTLLGHDATLQTNGETIHAHVLDIDPARGLVIRTHDGATRYLPAAMTTVLP